MVAKRTYTMTIEPEARADKCTVCGQCLEHCPQQIEIPDELKKTVETLA